LPNGSVRGR